MTLLVVLVGMVTMAMSMSGSTVALPRIGAELDASGTPLQWVMTGYFLTFACFTLVAGSLADRLGRRRTYFTGAAIVAGSFVMGAVSNDIWVLDAARTAAGVGAAGVMASGGAILASTFDGAEQTRAFAALGTTGGIGLALGPSVSGWLVNLLGWRATFLVFAAVFGLVLVGTAFVAESRSAERARMDWQGAVTLIAGLALLMLGVTSGPTSGWFGPRVIGLLAGGVLLLAGFVRRQRRVAHPVLDLTLIRSRQFLGWCVAATSMAIGFGAVLVFLPTYLQGANGASAGEAGLVMMLLTAPVLFAPMAGGWLVNRGVPAPRLVTLSLVLSAGGNAWLTVIHPGVHPVELAGPLIAIGTGMGLVVGITDGQALGLVEPERIGMAAGFLNTARGGGQALVLAVFGSVLISLVEARVGSAEIAGRVVAGDLAAADPAFLAEQFTAAWRVALWSIAGVVAVVALAVHVLLRARSGRIAGLDEETPGVGDERPVGLDPLV